MNFKKSFQKTLATFYYSLPILVGVLLLVSILNNLLKNSYSNFFTRHYIKDSLVGSILGSVSFGIPLTSYVIGGELLNQGVSLLAVTAFMLAWATVGIAMLPLEAAYLGKKFAVLRNAINFIFSIIIAVLVVVILDNL